MTLNDAIKQKDILAIKSMLQENDLKIEGGHPPLHEALMTTDLSIIKLIMDYYSKQNINVNLKDEYGWTACNFIPCQFITDVAVVHCAVTFCTKTEDDERIVKA